MVDFSVFDYLLDSVFVVNVDGKIVYLNELAQTFCQTSIRRVAGKALLDDFLSFAEPGILPFTSESHGYSSPSSLIETPFQLKKSGKEGKVQMTVRPMEDQKHWIFFLHDVGLEETLAAKYKSELRQKEEYAKNLEKLVEARTAELRSVNQTLNAILDSLGQGFFTFDRRGECGAVFTKACEDVLQGVPNKRKAWDVLRVPAHETEQFKKWMDSSFQELLPFDDLKGLGPNLFPHSDNKRVVLEFYPIRREQKTVSEIVVVATDKTAEYEAQMALESERYFAAMVVRFFSNKDQFISFLSSVRGSVENLRRLAAQSLNSSTINESLRILHTLEGESGTFALRELRDKTRVSQHILEPFKTKSVPAETQQAYVESLTDMLEKFERFLTEHDNIFHMKKVERSAEFPVASINVFYDELKQSPGNAALLAKFSDLFLKVTIESRLQYYDALVQSVSERLGKKSKRIIIEGGEIRIYPERLQNFFSSLVHLFRNALDHGLEEPTEREWAGKDPAGQIKVNVTRKDAGLFFVFSDDGRGIDPAVIREKLNAKFPDRDFASQTDEEIIQNVALPGFSSRETVGEFSGRGVGLDALREEVLRMGGTLYIRAKVGVGTVIEIYIPDPKSEAEYLRSA